MGSPVTIHGGNGSDTISFAFTVTGTNTTRYANAFATNVNTLLANGGSITPVTPNATQSGVHLVGADSTTVYVLTAPTDTAAPIPNYTIATSGYVIDTISGAAGIALDSAGGDTVLVAAVNAEATVTGAGGNNQIIFVTGNNVFDGTADTGGDTVVAGSGFDTLYTSETGNTTVDSGTGNSTVYLQDTLTGGLNDFVYLDDGSNTIYANGVGDAVIATIGGQTVYGDSVAGQSSYLAVEFVASGATSGDLVNALSSDTTAVFDYNTNNTIVGGTGLLYFIGGADVSASVDGGTGTAYLFGAAGDSITLGADTAGAPGATYFVSNGNETLNGAAATGALYAFAGDGDSVTGGAGYNLLTAGQGSETLVGGTGTNLFQVSENAAGANLTISDFSVDGNSTLLLDNGFTNADIQTIENSTNNVGGNLVVTISDSTTLTFTGITSGSQLTGHIITF